MNKISIIIPTFNRESFIGQTLDSVSNQTYVNWECIIVDDGSTDRTKNIISEYALNDPRIKLYDRNEIIKPKGACACRNQGVDLSNGEYLIFLDSDDLLEPFCLEQRIKAMIANPSLDFSIYPSLMFRHEPNDLRLWWNIDKNIDELTRQFHQDAICQTTGVIWGKSAFIRIGQWNEGLHLWQDIDLFLRAYIQGYRYEKFFHLPPDLHNRLLETSLSRSNFFDPAKMQSRVDIIQSSVSLLKKCEKYEYIREVRYMLVEVISGFSRMNKAKKANELIEWGHQKLILNLKEVRELRCMVMFRQVRLANFPYFSNKINRIENEFVAKDCTLGILHHEAT